ncbi:2-succinyl-6-hydroxy-2,4-cyclohexadiene-1-carboxylate synthase [uncultured Metabacillus sp.]|uniref:2-succinyl-6-hydroxy-2, 4-cyclohexadiene-1-carboxylate synthase n=1 Tax=uncultured Metabacillus sp. TaxID=2860135 RepID=UPI00260803E5|nr:2-succinyl-6-hydroxy-2,4-cyclohexadiene-1-carboxylate synthase [uncultured Metabacillus sp.]
MKIRGIEYNVEVKSKGQPLVLLHGFTGSSSNWTSILNEISDTKFILIDIIGHGRTESPEDPARYRTEEAVEDLISILNKLNIEKANFLGYSMGGRLALSFTATYPNRVNKLILESSSPGIKDMDERIKRKISDEKLARSIIKNGMVSFVDYWEDIPLFSTQKRLPKEQRKQIREKRLENSSLGLANSLIGMGTGVQPSWWKMLPSIKNPILLVCGELDQKFCEIANKMNQMFPNSTLNEIKDAGHAIHVEQPRIFGKIVNEFLHSAR